MSCVKAHSLPRSRRLNDTEVFTAIFRFQHQANSRHVQIFAKPNDLPYSRIGLIVSKKVERGAVGRNRIKRLFRETFRTSQEYRDAHSMDWIMRLRRPVTETDSQQLIAEIRLLMRQLQQCQD